MKACYDLVQAPFGIIHVIMDDYGVRRLVLTPELWEKARTDYSQLEQDQRRCSEVTKQLSEYFQGIRREFELDLSIAGSAFDQRVWEELRLLPYGQTCSYADVAARIGRAKSYRAVGQANRRNPLPIIIPCHRVIGKNGSLTGYIGPGHTGIKQFLLDFERSRSEV